MAEELKHLIDQIHKEGIEKAEQEAKEIIEKAEQEAKEIIEKAQHKLNETTTLAQKESKALQDKSIQSIKQAARDLLISIGQSSEKIISKTLKSSIEKELDSSLLKSLITDLVKNESSVEIKVNKEDINNLKDYLNQLNNKNGSSIKLSDNNDILSGFTIGYKNNNVYLDYTSQSIADALTSFLRPELAKIISEIVEEDIIK